MKKNRIPDYFTIHESPTKGCSYEENEYKIWRSFEEKLAKKIPRHIRLYRSGSIAWKNASVFYYQNSRLCQVKNLITFIKLHTKPEKRILVTDAVSDRVLQFWFDSEEYRLDPLPEWEPRYVLLENGYFDVISGSFTKFKGNNYCPGYPHFAVNASFMKQQSVSIQLPTQQLRVLGQLTSGFAITRCIFWSADALFSDFAKSILNTVLPEEGAIIRLKASSPTDEFNNACNGFNHCVIIELESAGELTRSLWSKLKILAVAKKPALVIAPFLPFVVDNNPELDLFKESLLIVPPANFADYPKAEQIDQTMIDQIARAALKQLHELIINPLPDDCADVEDIFYRPDPNNVKDILERFIRDCLIFTGNESDAIPVSELTEALKEYVKKFGGAPSKVKDKGVGKYLNDLGIKKTEISGRKFVLYYAWKSVAA